MYNQPCWITQNGNPGYHSQLLLEDSMQIYRRLLPRRPALALLLFTVILGSLARGAAPSGTYGALFSAQFIDDNTNNGGAVLALLNFDGGGNISGSYTIEVQNRGGTTITGALNGSYTTNPDGSGT